MSLRRHTINEADVHRIISHLRAHDKITPDDIISRPRPNRKKGQSPTTPIPWIHDMPLAGNWQHAGLKAGPNNTNVLYAKESDIWKRVVPVEAIDSFLRTTFLLNPKSTMPLGRDSAYYHVQKTTATISRRALYKFLAKQQAIQITKNIPNERKKGGINLQARGYCEMDPIEGKGKDLAPGGEAFKQRGDWYWLALIDILTGYGLVTTIRHKKASIVAVALKELLDILEGAMGKKVHTIAADHGREFYRDVRKLLKRRKIKQLQVPRASRVEKFNMDFQRNFYRLLRLRRGTFASLEEQALNVTNNTRNKHTKKTPKEALTIADEALRGPYNDNREEEKAYHARDPKIGDKCRVLIKLRKNIRPQLKIGDVARLYKAYHARHFTREIHKVKAKTRTKPPRFYVNGKWHDRDALLLIDGVDAETNRQVALKK